MTSLSRRHLIESLARQLDAELIFGEDRQKKALLLQGAIYHGCPLDPTVADLACEALTKTDPPKEFRQVVDEVRETINRVARKDPQGLIRWYGLVNGPRQVQEEMEDMERIAKLREEGSDEDGRVF